MQDNNHACTDTKVDTDGQTQRQTDDVPNIDTTCPSQRLSKGPLLCLDHGLCLRYRLRRCRFGCWLCRCRYACRCCFCLGLGLGLGFDLVLGIGLCILQEQGQSLILRAGAPAQQLKEDTKIRQGGNKTRKTKLKRRPIQHTKAQKKIRQVQNKTRRSEDKATRQR